MRKQVPYFDSQASAAAQLNVDIDELRDAKAAGCPAFRSGRVYLDELVRWLKEHPALKKRPVNLDEPDFLEFRVDWERRRELLFGLREFLDWLFDDGALSAEQYKKLGDNTIPLIIKLGQVWDAGIDEAGYRSCWRECRADATRK